MPATWAAVDRQIQQAAPQTRLLVARVTGGGCQAVNAMDATTPAPLGSAFKLYVLDALARAIAAGTVSWDQRLTLTSQLTSLPSGELSTEPAGTQVTVLQAAPGHDLEQRQHRRRPAPHAGRPDGGRVGRGRLGDGGPRPGHAVPHHRELFVLKLDDWPALASRYLALGARPAGHAHQHRQPRPAQRAPVTAPTGWTQPRDIGTIEWFASPADICRVYASLASLSRQPGLAPVASILAINNGSLNLDPRQWSTTWFKGGSEPGVVTLNYLATTRTGQSYVVSALAANPSAPIPQTSTVQLLGAIKAAFTLAAG